MAIRFIAKNHPDEFHRGDNFLPKACGFLLPCSNLLLSNRKTKTTLLGGFVLAEKEGFEPSNGL